MHNIDENRNQETDRIQDRQVWKWITETMYIDMDTGELLHKCQIGKSHYIVKTISKQVETNTQKHEKRIRRTNGCKRTGGIQQEIWGTIS